MSQAEAATWGNARPRRKTRPSLSIAAALDKFGKRREKGRPRRLEREIGCRPARPLFKPRCALEKREIRDVISS